MHTKIIPKHHAIAAFVNTITPAVDAYIDVCDSMLNRVRRNVQRREVNDIYMLIDIWEGVYKLLREHASLIAVSDYVHHQIVFNLNYLYRLVFWQEGSRFAACHD